ncbi:MAG TPA: DNA-binding response regulator [Verrucomicrobiae bacterium]|nr:DNA-binding response regulator [Verrucomicrobiae bacterium]
MSNVMPREEFRVNGEALEQKPLVLVVDDDPDMQSLIIGALSRAGTTCVGASSVEEALTAMQTQKISLTVLDWGLDRSGVEVLTVARELYPSMPVVVISGMPLEVRTDAVVNKADAFLSKPFSATVLAGQVMQLIERTRQAPAILLPQRPEDVLSLQEVQSIYIRHVVQLLEGNKSRAAEALGIHRHTISTSFKG